jgi:hypothetical protein
MWFSFSMRTFQAQLHTYPCWYHCVRIMQGSTHSWRSDERPWNTPSGSIVNWFLCIYLHRTDRGELPRCANWHILSGEIYFLLVSHNCFYYTSKPDAPSQMTIGNIRFTCMRTIFITECDTLDSLCMNVYGNQPYLYQCTHRYSRDVRFWNTSGDSAAMP